MAIGFLRQHQKTLLWPLAIVIIVTFVFMWGGPRATGSGSDVAEVGGRPISDIELAARKRILMEITQRRVEDGDALINIVRADAARNLGLGVADEEIREFLRAVVKRSLKKSELTTEDYRKWLHENDIDPQLLQNVVSEILLQEKGERLLDASATITRQELFLAYCRQKDMLTVRYVDFSSASFRDRIDQPTDEDAKKYFDTNKKGGRREAPDLFHPKNAKVDYIFASFKDFQAKVEVTKEKLEFHYEATKHRYHAEEDEDGDAEGEEGDHPKHKDFEQVKAEVEKDFREKEGRPLATEAVRKAIEEAKAGDKPLEDICKAHGLSAGALDAITDDDLTEHEIFGKASRWARSIFSAAERPKEGVWSEPTTVELGVVSHIELAFNEARLKVFEEAKEAIIKRLVISRSAQAALEAAIQARQELLDETFDRALMKEVGPLPGTDSEVSPFGNVAVGEVIGKPELAPAKDENDEELVYRIGILTNRTSPTLAAFLADTTWRSWPPPKYIRSTFIGGGWRMTAARESDAKFLQPRDGANK